MGANCLSVTPSGASHFTSGSNPIPRRSALVPQGPGVSGDVCRRNEEPPTPTGDGEPPICGRPPRRGTFAHPRATTVGGPCARSLRQGTPGRLSVNAPYGLAVLDLADPAAETCLSHLVLTSFGVCWLVPRRPYPEGRWRTSAEIPVPVGSGNASKITWYGWSGANYVA